MHPSSRRRPLAQKGKLEFNDGGEHFQSLCTMRRFQVVFMVFDINIDVTSASAEGSSSSFPPRLAMFEPSSQRCARLQKAARMDNSTTSPAALAAVDIPIHLPFRRLPIEQYCALYRADGPKMALSPACHTSAADCRSACGGTPLRKPLVPGLLRMYVLPFLCGDLLDAGNQLRALYSAVVTVIAVT